MYPGEKKGGKFWVSELAPEPGAVFQKQKQSDYQQKGFKNIFK